MDYLMYFIGKDLVVEIMTPCRWKHPQPLPSNAEVPILAVAETDVEAVEIYTNYLEGIRDESSVAA